ncbi:GNAT family N-acetyltransferase [Saccharospirillum mangrovi]|uniref:GNAT family N-acetyltransferase n=1 Tax=Saccharospirillum mangrovi TaxID=2161747 RepID=UPI000D3C4E75|nr:GNAT family N-acetyltransferase [Saccharospirillum mangrovi]
MSEPSLNYFRATLSDAVALSDIRAHAMKPSLVALGRYDEQVIRQRLLNKFQPDDTWKIFLQDNLVGFYVLTDHSDHLYLDHLYVLPSHQGLGIGRNVIERVQDDARRLQKTIRLGALKGSRSNAFYRRHGFLPTHEGEFDIYYQFDAAQHDIGN